jgi:hypothetical protein
MNGVYLVPPMEDEPPADFVAFVAVRLGDLQREAARLTGGHADEVYPDAFADVACHWRRLRLRRRLTRRDVAGEFLAHRLATRAKQWRDDQVYEVEVQLLRPPVTAAARASSIALRKAALLPDTVRIQARPLAEASIAWSHACRQARRHQLARTAVAVFIIFFALVQVSPYLPD